MAETKKTEESAEAPKKKLSLVDHLTAIVEGFEDQTKPFAPEDLAAVQLLQKRLSRTLGLAREP